MVKHLWASIVGRIVEDIEVNASWRASPLPPIRAPFLHESPWVRCGS